MKVKAHTHVIMTPLLSASLQSLHKRCEIIDLTTKSVTRTMRKKFTFQRHLKSLFHILCECSYMTCHLLPKKHSMKCRSKCLLCTVHYYNHFISDDLFNLFAKIMDYILFFSILQMKKLNHIESKQRAGSHTAIKWQAP